MRNPSSSRFAGAIALGLGLIACGSSSNNASFTSDAGSGTDGTTRDARLDSPSGDDQRLGTGSPVTSIAITPVNPTVVVLNGAIPPATAFQVTGKTKQGTTVSVTNALWSFDSPNLGSINGAGSFTATGLVGGVGTLTATADGLMATTTVTVQLQYMLDPNNVAATLGPKFKAATTADPQMNLDYPYDQTVFPRGLPAPVAQWCLGAAPACTGNATDVYDIKVTSPTATFEAFTTTPTPTAPSFTFPTLPTDVWGKLTSSTTGTMTFSIARYDGTTAYIPKTETWTVAAANLAGTIYYWEIDLGTVVKMPLGQGPGAFLQIPGGESPAITCVACHSVSKNGSTVVAAFNGSASPWGTFDTQTGASIFVDGTDPNNGPGGSGFEAISPDGAWVLWGQEQQTTALNLNAANAAATVGTLSVPGGSPVQPAWSPDGKHVAFGVRTDGNWLDYTTANLWLSDANLAVNPPTFSATAQVVANTATRPVTIYPTFSPDSQWIAFERSTQARSRGATAELWLTSLDGSTITSLDAANLGTGLYSQNDANYEPTFMPVAVGGYFWLVFVSERVYGNTLTSIVEGTSDAPGRHKQLWVTAIDASPVAGKDPSHPAFWLPGQNTADQNMRGEWALDPCKALGATCTAGYECCGGYCQTGDGGVAVCGTPSGGCAATGNACKMASDCCDPSDSCVAGFCNASPK